MAVYTEQAQKLLSFQLEDGSWGKFHSLGVPTKAEPYTTEQATRRLSILGFTIEDEPIRKAVGYMHRCLTHEVFIRDRREKTHDWDIFTSLMLATWIRRFTKKDELANAVVKAWCDVITSAFQSGGYSQSDYEQAYITAFSKPVKGDRFIDCFFARFLIRNSFHMVFIIVISISKRVGFVKIPTLLLCL